MLHGRCEAREGGVASNIGDSARLIRETANKVNDPVYGKLAKQAVNIPANDRQGRWHVWQHLLSSDQLQESTRKHMSAENLVEQATVSHLELLDIPSISRIPSKTPVFNISNCNVTINNN